MKAPVTAFQTILAGAILMTLAPTVFSLEAEESATNSVVESERSHSTEQSNPGEEQNEKPDKPASTARPPQGENLKNRELGAAFRQFRPSEAISADNAVPFPVDI